ANSVEIRLDLPEPMPALDGELSTLIFRVTQESLTNAAKHAHARRVEVTLREGEQRLSLSVRDDGRGCDVNSALAGGQSHGSGLGGLRDRVRAHDGDLHVESSPGSGFLISIDVPLTNAGSLT